MYTQQLAHHCYDGKRNMIIKTDWCLSMYGVALISQRLRNDLHCCHSLGYSNSTIKWLMIICQLRFSDQLVAPPPITTCEQVHVVDCIFDLRTIEYVNVKDVLIICGQCNASYCARSDEWIDCKLIYYNVVGGCGVSCILYRIILKFCSWNLI